MERGGTPEQHREAGKAGGEATAAKHGRDFYEEIGRKGGESRRGNPEASAGHHEAASHHEAAAHHHRQAAHHYAEGDDEQAGRHAERASQHSQQAQAHTPARNERGQFVSSGNQNGGSR